METRPRCFLFNLCTFAIILAFKKEGVPFLSDVRERTLSFQRPIAQLTRVFEGGGQLWFLLIERIRIYNAEMRLD